MTISVNKSLARNRAYTLFEILLALGIVAVLLGITVPMVLSSFGTTNSDDVVQVLQKTASAARAYALESGEGRRLQITPSGLASKVSSIPSAELPAGWKLQIQRLAENRFRKPDKLEFWEFNGAGISEPIIFRLSNKEGESLIVRFDPLTALILGENE